ncbi:hypothetical protein T02_7216 [Trichinella nativa]|uniref:Uncharacterized protein n=1 Tax=Trichinella nativa TaxID=6335 RepID=A0A0V1LCP8_9BILA|nr:hypothetical protein T02_7423 [Trichinella nativa]KRZ57238.1 hypothetical protein T02_7216 [Trichinella nativa]
MAADGVSSSWSAADLLHYSFIIFKSSVTWFDVAIWCYWTDQLIVLSFCFIGIKVNPIDLFDRVSEKFKNMFICDHQNCTTRAKAHNFR